ncbi:MAG TPA: TonB-dependent receptor [Aeromonadales bacterium]|nr:TonB-dependent receptor [Aeromonadales bacterium]
MSIVVELSGIERNDRGIPQWKFDLTADWKKGDWGASWTMRYVDSLTESCSDFQDGSPVSFVALGLCSNPNTTDEELSTNTLGSTSVYDLQLRWAPSGWDTDVQFSGGIQNLFDNDPPACTSCSLNGYDPSTYWPQGQFFYLQASLKL